MTCWQTENLFLTPLVHVGFDISSEQTDKRIKVKARKTVLSTTAVG